MRQTDSLSRRANWAKEVVKEMKKARVKVLRNDAWKTENKLVLKEGKVYILKG